MKSFVVFALTLLSAVSLRADDLAEQIQAEINLARTAPQRYAQIVAGRAAGQQRKEGDRAVREAIRFLEKASPLPPLTRSEGMTACALSHVVDQGPAGARGHNGSDGSTPWKRLARFGKWTGHAAENISYGLRDARSIVVAFIVDDGVRDRGHRLNIFGSDFHLAGIACGPHASFGTMCVIDFATAFSEDDGKVTVRTAQPVWRF